MNKKLTTFEWTIIALMGVILVLGGGGVVVISGKIQERKSQLEEHTQSMTSISKRVHYPSTQNMDQIKENSKSIEGFMIAMKPLLQPSENRLSEVKSIEAVEFKQQLATSVDSLRALTKTQNVTIPVDFYFGFSRYQKQNPKNKDTIVLGKQLLGIEKMITALIGCGPQKIEMVSRSFEEDGEVKKGGAVEPEQLKFTSFVNPDGFYTTYPLEVEFVGTPVVLQQFLNGLAKLPYIFVVRSCYSTSLKPIPSRLDELQRQYATGNAQGTKPPPLVPVLGDEKIKFKVRVDLIEWNGVSESAKNAEKKS